MQVPALELYDNVDLFRFTGALHDLLFEHVVLMNCDRVLEDLVERHDNMFVRQTSPPSFFSFYRKARIESSPHHSLVNPVYDFIRADNRVFVVSIAGFRKEFISILMDNEEFAGMVKQDYSFYNATDDQVSSGELSYEEWRERSKFWHENVSLLSGRATLKFNLLRDNELFPGFDNLSLRLKTAEYATMSYRREKLAKNLVVDKALKENSDASDGDYSRFFEILNNSVREGYPGWEEEEANLPALPELRL